MENNNTKKIEEEIRQYKLYKIQIVEVKIREYKNTFNKIKENIIIKFTKNVSSNILRIIFLLVTISLLVIGLFFIFPEQIIKMMEENGGFSSEQEKKEFILTTPYIGYILITISMFFSFISILLKKNIRKRNTIYNLSKLINEVIDYMDDNVKEDKKKYEYFVDSAADIENRRNSNTTTQ